MENQKYEYMMLSRLKQDCEYFINYGNANETHCLYYKSVCTQINEMQKLYNILIIKPKWLTQKQINKYNKTMLILKYKKNIGAFLTMFERENKRYSKYISAQITSDGIEQCKD